MHRARNKYRDSHEVSFSTFGRQVAFEFTSDIDSLGSEEAPTPYIADVTVANGTVRGQPSASTGTSTPRRSGRASPGPSQSN